MPATTSTLKLPYPLDSDRLEDFPTIAKQSAQLIDQAATVSAVVLPTFDNAWRHDPDGGMVRTVNGVSHLNISIVRTKDSFHMEAGGIVDIYRVNNLVKVPSTREWVMCGTLFGPNVWPMPVFLNNGLVRVLCYGPVDFVKGSTYRGSAVWTA